MIVIAVICLIAGLSAGFYLGFVRGITYAVDCDWDESCVKGND